MKAILMAAGRGTRISKSIPPIPKCTLPVGEVPLIRRTIAMLEDAGIDCAVVSGYKHECIDEVLQGTNVRIFYNPFFDVTNSIASLYLAKEFIDEDRDLILANADVFWTPEILRMLLSADASAVMLADKTRAADGDYFFGTENGAIVRYGKDLKIDERDCEYVGIARIRADFVPAFVRRLNEMIGEQLHGVWWENVLYSMTEEARIRALDVEGNFWAEVDFIEDYQRILDYAANHL